MSMSPVSPQSHQRPASPATPTRQISGGDHVTGAHLEDVGGLARVSQSSQLNDEQVERLKHFYTEKSLRTSSTNDHVHAGHHHEKPTSIVTAVISGIINWLLMFGLCCAYGMILFGDSWHLQHQTIGVKMNLFTACFVGLTVGIMSKIKVAIGGPDLNPVVFLAGFVQTIAESLAGQLSLEYPSKRRLQEWNYLAQGRLLGADSSVDVEFCTGEHLQVNMEACETYHEELRATVLFATAISSISLGLIFAGLGRFKMTRFVTYVPTSIMEAFLACVGYKVFKYALIFVDFEPRQFIPAALCGVTLYFVKALHYGNPAIMIPLFLFVPLGIFYIIIYASGSDVSQARKDGLFFSELPDVSFWESWKSGYMNAERINFKAWQETIPELLIMIVVSLLDCLLKLAGTENKLKMNVDKDYEIQLHGVSNLFTAVSFSSVGYMQLKFNVINFGVMGNLNDRRGGLTYAILCGAGFFGTIQYFNFMPRFFLSLLLFFAGAGFVAENLWGSRAYLQGSEWFEIICILLVFILTEKLLYAVVTGALLACVSFIMTCAEIPCVLGTQARGGAFASIDRHEPVLQKNLEHITNYWLMVIRLKGYVFFGSAQKLVKEVRAKIVEQRSLEQYQRIRYIIFDCEMLDGMDASAAKGMRTLSGDASAANVQFLWSSIDAKRAEEFKQRQLFREEAEWFPSFNEALLYVEDHALSYLKELQERWLCSHPGLQLYQATLHKQDEFDPFRTILKMDTTRHGCPWVFCNKVRLEQHRTLLWEPGQIGVDMFLIHAGAVGLYAHLPGTYDHETLSSPVAIYRHGWFLNTEFLANMPTQYYAVALEDGEALSWNESQWFKMTHVQPAMSTAMSKAVMRQKRYDWKIMEKKRAETADADSPASPGLHSSLTQVYAGQASVSNIDVFLPEEVKTLFGNLQTAMLLESYGLFACPDSSESADDQGAAGGKSAILPNLPERYMRSLEIGFDTFCKNAEVSGKVVINLDDVVIGQAPRPLTKEAKLSLSPPDVIKALNYAGVTNTMLQLEGKKEFTYEDFVLLARCALMSRLDSKQLESVQSVFNRYDVDNSKELDLHELEKVLQETFHPFVSVEETVSICAFWDSDRSGKMDIREFRELVARLIKQVEQEWSVIVALRELKGDATATLETRLTFEDLSANSHVTMEKEMAKEMLWAADWRTNQGGGSFLEVRDIPVFLLLHMESKAGSLPPPPPSKHTMHSSQLMTPKCKTKIPECTSASIDIDNPISQLVLDLRREQSRSLVLQWTFADLDVNAPKQGLSSVFRLNTASKSFTVDTAPPPAEPKETRTKLLTRLDELLNKPESSKAAALWSFITGCTIFLSFCVLFLRELTTDWPITNEVVEVYITAFFTLELLLRALVTEDLRAFVTNLRNICDFVAVLPYYMEIAFDRREKWWSLLRINRIIRLFRLVRGMRTMRFFKGLSDSMGAIVTILAIIWGIYLKNSGDDGK